MGHHAEDLFKQQLQVGNQCKFWEESSRMFVKELLPVLLTLSVMCVSLWAATNWSVKFIQPISRRLTNLPYILWMFSYEALILSLFLTVDITILAAAKLAQSPRPPPYAPNTVTSSSRQRRAAPPPPAPLCVMSAVDYNQLGFFLMANMLTGLVNYLVDTLHTGPIWALVVMVIYMATLQCIFTALHTYKIKLKF